MSVKILSVFAAFLLLVLLVPAALAYDTARPARFGVSYVVASDTAFLMLLHPTQTDDNRMDFVAPSPPWMGPPAGVASGVEPKDLPAGTYWARIQNIGTVTETYNIRLGLANQPGITLFADDDGPMGANVPQAVDTIGITLTSWSNVPINNIVYLYATATFDSNVNPTLSPGYSSTNNIYISDTTP